jgi:hypothetical protein
MTTDPTGTGAIPQEEWVDAAAEAVSVATRNGVLLYPRTIGRTVLSAVLPLIAADLRAQWISEAPVTGPWGAVKEIEQLTADLAEVRIDRARLFSRLGDTSSDLAAARQQLDAVRALHMPYEHDNGLCRGCEQLVCRTRDLLAVAPTDAPATKDGGE